MKTLDGPKIELRAFCLKCGVFHDILTSPGDDFLREMDEWQHKHWGPEHEIEFTSRRRIIPRDFDDSEIKVAPWWLEHAEFKSNANIKLATAASAAMTFTAINSLASDSNLLAGAEATLVDNTSNLYLDYGLSGNAKNNTSSAPTVSTTIQVYAYGNQDDTPTFAPALTGADSARTLVQATVNSLRPVVSMTVAATTSQVNPFGPVSLSSLFGNFLPFKWSVWVVHNSGQALAASGNTFSYKPLYLTSV